jgi:hypothetical protein
MSRLTSFLRTREVAFPSAARLVSQQRIKGNDSAYWATRADAIYLQYVYYIARVVGRDAVSIADVGSNGCPYLEWYDWIPQKTSFDLRNPYRSATVKGIKGDFLAAEISKAFDLCLCLQVLEHIPDVEAFARKLLDTSKHLVVSVPYKWKQGKPNGHIHDPIDKIKLWSWFGRAPNYHVVVAEPVSGLERLVCFFDCKSPDRKLTRVDTRARRPSRFA